MWKEYVKAARDLLIPPLCFACGNKTRLPFLCHACRSGISFLSFPLCPGCAQESRTPSLFCSRCRKNPPSYDRLICAAYYQEPLCTLLHLFKYKKHDFLSTFFAGLIQSQLTRLGIRLAFPQCCTAVPLHPQRLKERGYNQSALIGKKVAKYFEIPFKNDIIFEVKRKRSQTELTGSEREANVKGAYRVTRLPKKGHLVLIDDIFTTGATADECCRLLKKHGATNITVVTAARA